MGVRFRKSKKVGPFRFTLSKSGLGMSVGVKGFRVTKTSSGRVRTTASIPGTGISYVKDKSLKSSSKSTAPCQQKEEAAMKKEVENTLPRVHKKTSFYICLALGILDLLTAFQNLLFGNLDNYETWWYGLLGAAIFLGAAYLLHRRNKKEAEAYDEAVKEKVAQERRQQEEARREKEAREAAALNEREARLARQAEWEKTHGKIYTNLAGVTFKNSDGTSRQAALKDAYANDCAGTLEFEQYEYQGEPAVLVCYEGVGIGNIPKARVSEVLAILDRLSSARLDVEVFVPELDDDDVRPDKIYRADLTLIYTKTAPD